MYAQEAASVHARTHGRAGLAIFLGLVISFFINVPPVWSFEVTTAVEPHGRSGVVAPVVLRPDSSQDDPCLYLLRAARGQDGAAAMDRHYREASGSALAVGLVLGVRFALGPQEQVRPGQRVRPVAAFHVGGGQDGPQPLSALAIADYRACRNQHTLQALTD